MADHEHVLNQEQCKAKIVKYFLKRKVEDQPQQPPAQILRTEMAGLSDGVLSILPERENLETSMRKVQRYLIVFILIRISNACLFYLF